MNISFDSDGSLSSFLFDGMNFEISVSLISILSLLFILQSYRGGFSVLRGGIRFDCYRTMIYLTIGFSFLLVGLGFNCFEFHSKLTG